MKHFSLPKDGGLIEAGLPKDILHGKERIKAVIATDPFEGSYLLCQNVIKTIKKFQAENPGKTFKLGLSTGSSPVSLYNYLSEACAAGEISFKDVEIFSIDEYYAPDLEDKQCRNNKLKTALLDKIDILPENIHLPDHTVALDAISEYCEQYDEQVRGLDLLVLGFGEKGELGFNEPGSLPTSHTRLVLLSYASRKKYAKNFGHNAAKTPSQAITMGISTILSAKKIMLMAWGEDKADAVYNIVEQKANPDYPASLLQIHEKIKVYVDENAASRLTRIVAPWCIGPCEWTDRLRRKAVVWLCQKVGKPILKLTYKDYVENCLSELLEVHGNYSDINIKVFNELQHTITGWPGGKPGVDDSTRPVPSSPNPKRVLIFSPHPDDDVISMGGTFIRLTHQGHDVHVAYETSGNVAVHDDVVIQHMDAAYELGFGDRFEEVKALVASKVIGEPEPRALLDLKAAIRRSEAKSACRSFGLNDRTNVHFLNLPFYESGGIEKLPRSQADVDIIKALMNELKPHMVFMAGDLADPHGTHRVCTECALEALDQLREEGAEWISECHVWLYRGAWMEWEIERVDMAVPLSPDEVIEKRHAIYRHLSQKDIVPFPGDDPREFWQRAEDRTQNTARNYDALGMAEYQAMEVFLKLW